jgi:HPt (histidine-containing phosphotransfer) domain-containing protein
VDADSEQIEHLEELRHLHIKRLRVLELKEAQQGPNTPAEILVEIKDLREKIATIEVQLTSMRRLSPSATTQILLPETKISDYKLVEITFRGDFGKLDDGLQQALVRAIAAIVEVPSEQVQVLRVMEGSIVFRVLMPKDGADRLQALFDSQDPLIGELEIQRVKRVEEPHDSVNARVFQKVAGLSDEDASLFLESLIKEYIKDSNMLISTMKDAVARQDATGILVAAHRLKSSSAIVGAERLAAICDILEQTIRDDESLSKWSELILQVEAEYKAVRIILEEQYIKSI